MSCSEKRVISLNLFLFLITFSFNITTYFVSAHLTELFTGEFAPLFWFAIFIGMIIPIIIILFKKGRKPLPMFIAGVMVVIGAWFKRYLIVTPTLLHPFLPMHDAPEKYKHYFPSWQEWAIAMGSLAGALLIITLLARIFPVISIYKTLTDENETAQK